MTDSIVIKGVLLDIDGTLVLSNDAHAHAWVDAFKHFGIDVRFADVRPLIGMGADKIIPALAPGLEPGEGLGKQISELRKQIFFERYAHDLQPAPGARPLCARMHNEGLKLVVASSAQKDELDVLLKIAHIEDLIDSPGSGSEGKPSKPAPDVVADALNRIKLHPTNVIMLGDTPYDILAAAQCSVNTISFRCGGWNDARLRDAVAIYDHPANLLAHYDESPLRKPVTTAAKHGPR